MTTPLYTMLHTMIIQLVNNKCNKVIFRGKAQKDRQDLCTAFRPFKNEGKDYLVLTLRNHLHNAEGKSVVVE